MGRQERGHYDPDGYKQLETKGELAKSNAKPPKISKELSKLRKEEQKKKTKDPRAAKLYHPKGSGKRKGDFR